MRRETLQALNAARRARQAVLHVTNLDTGDSTLFFDTDRCNAEIRKGFVERQLGELSGAGAVFANVYLPPPQVVLIGAVHISQVLAQMVGLVGLQCRVIDPRTAFATQDRFCGIDLDEDWPVDAFARQPLDRQTALVALTHDPKIDDMPLLEALRAGCFYIGALGSRKTHAARTERLKASGVTEPEIARIHSPIGLAIGASNPAEIAVAILAEIIATIRSL